MNLLHLQYFYTVAREGSFSKASSIVKINQSALSRMVRTFEEHMGLVLLERQPRGVKLTSDGERVFRHASAIFSRVDALIHEIEDAVHVCQGELLIGTTDAIAYGLLPPALERISKQWPELYPVIQVGSARSILDQIVDGRIEFGLLFHTPDLPISLAVTKRWSLPFVLVCAREARNRKKVLQSFIGSREVDDIFNRKFPTLTRWREVEPAAKIAISSNSLLLHRELASRALGIAVLPQFLVTHELQTRHFVNLLTRKNLHFDLKLVQRKSVPLSLNASTFIQTFASVIRDTDSVQDLS